MTKRAPKKPATPKNKGGRPTKKSQAIIDTVCEGLSKGVPLAALCRQEGMPCPNTVRAWADGDSEVSERIARAREDGEDWLAAECLQIADTPMEGVTEEWEPVEIENPDDPDGPPVVELQLSKRKVDDMLQHRKLQIETRLKLLAKWNPKKYGDFQRNEITGAGGSALIPATINIKGVKAPRRE